MQKVDPFIPVNKRPVQSPQPRRQPVRSPSVDGLQSKPRALPHLQNQSARYINPRPRPASADPTPDPVKPESKNARSQSPSKVSSSGPEERSWVGSQKKARLSSVKKTLKILSQATILIALFSLGFLLRSVVVGQAIILLYAIFAFVFKVESRITFALVLISFGVVLAASLRSDTALASVFAVYAFLLLVVGTISLGREVRNEI